MTSLRSNKPMWKFVIGTALSLALIFPGGIVGQSCEKKLVSIEVINRLDAEIFEKKHGFTTGLLRAFEEQVLISINGIQPLTIWENQDFVVNYTVTNLSLEPANGTVSGRFDDHSLTPIGSATVHLLPAESVDGQMKSTWGVSLKGKQLKLRYADKIVCHTVPSPHFPFDPSPVDICIAGVLAEDTANLEIRSVGEILSSEDPLGPQPVASGANCGPGLYARSLDVKDEWASVPDGIDVPVAGRVINHHKPGHDFPWSHPFDADYSFNVAPDLAYFNILNKTTIADTIDCTPDGIKNGRGSGDICEAFEVERRHGLTASGALHTEIEQRLIPEAYRPDDGDRVYIRGRRIIDCGHNDFSVEMHPPTIVAKASKDPLSGKVTSTLFVMPYLTQQKYLPSDQDFVHQMIGEFSFTLLAAPAPLNLFARIDNVPFDRMITANYKVSIPTVQRRTRTKLAYHFIRRPGVDIHVTPRNSYEVDVQVTLDPKTYRPLAAPDCKPKVITLTDAENLADLSPGSITDLFRKVCAGVIVGLPLIPIPAPILINAMVSAKNGLLVSDCTVPNGATFAPESTLDNSVVEDPSQPYPIYGWLSLEWID